MNSIPTLDETDGLAAESTLLQSTTWFNSVREDLRSTLPYLTHKDVVVRGGCRPPKAMGT